MNISKAFSAILIIALVSPVCDHLSAQEINENNFTLYSRHEGLSHSNVTGIVQDSTGYLWLATAYGLNRFNGNNFVQFHTTRDSTSLPDEYISGLVWLNNHEFAAYTSDGLHIVDTRTWSHRNLLIPYEDRKYLYKFNGILAVRTNDAGQIFVVTRSGFYQFNKNLQLEFRYDHYGKNEVARTPFAFGRKLLSLDDGRFVVLTSDGLYVYNVERKLFRKLIASDCPELAQFLDYPRLDYEFFQVRPGCFLVMRPDSNSLVYLDVRQHKQTSATLPFLSAASEFDYRSTLVNMDDSLFYLTGNVSGFYKIRIDPATGSIKFYPQKYFSSYFCSYLFRDRDHSLWIATNRGLLKQDITQMHIQQQSIPASIQDSYPTSVIDDIYAGKDKVYVAMRGKAGLLIFNKEPFQFAERISFEDYSRNPNSIYAITPIGDTALLLATNGPLCLMNLKTHRRTTVPLDSWNAETGWISALAKDKNQNTWIATDNIYKYDPRLGKAILMLNQQQVDDRVQWAARIAEDAAGNIWVAGHGLLRYNIQSNQVDRLIDSLPSIRLPDNQVPCFAAATGLTVFGSTAITTD